MYVMRLEALLMYDMLNSFILFTNNFFNLKIYNNITIYDIFMFVIIIGGSFTLIKIIMGRRT